MALCQFVQPVDWSDVTCLLSDVLRFVARRIGRVIYDTGKFECCICLM